MDREHIFTFMFGGGVTIFVVLICALILSESNAHKQEANQAACAALYRKWEATEACYEDAACMVTGDDYRLVYSTLDEIARDCPNEWKAVQVITEGAPTKKAD